MTVKPLSAPTEEQIEEARQFLIELDNGLGPAINPGVIESLCFPGSIQFGWIGFASKNLLWRYMEQSRPDLLDGFVANLVNGDLDIHETQKAIAVSKVRNPDVRAVYLRRLKQWADQQKAQGQPEDETQKSIEDILKNRILELIARGAHSRRKLVNEDADMTVVFQDLAKAGGDGMAEWGLSAVLSTACLVPPGNTENSSIQAGRVGEMVKAFLVLGADPHALNPKLLADKTTFGAQEPEHPNLLQQILLWRCVSGFGPHGGQGESDPLINALIDGGGEWREAWNAPSTSDTMRETLKQHPLVRRGLLTDMTHTREQETPGRKKNSL